ncbi:MAG: TetR family transcriptional regulator [Actinophytocola sp.]|nr:TetR family transcriptional regulator [Actinophytocola sp.]
MRDLDGREERKDAMTPQGGNDTESSGATVTTLAGRPEVLSSDGRGATTLSPKGQRTRQRLLTAARAVFERDGFLDARVVDIATEAGVAHGSFYTYFDSKTEIFRSVVADVMSLVWHTRTSTDGDPDLSPYQRIERANRQFVRVYRENGTMLGLMEQAMTFDDEVRQLRLMVRQRSVERVRLNIEQMQKEGTVRGDLDAFCASSALVSMVSNFVYFWLVMGEGDYDDEAAVHTLTQLWASALGMKID